MPTQSSPARGCVCGPLPPGLQDDGRRPGRGLGQGGDAPQHHGLVCVNQAFQRYNVILTGLGDVSIRDFVDFLTVRGHTPSVAFDGFMHDQGLTIEYALSRKAAEQFVADYAVIGLQVRAEFVRSQEKVIKISQVKPGFIKVA